MRSASLAVLFGDGMCPLDTMRALRGLVIEKQ